MTTPKMNIHDPNRAEAHGNPVTILSEEECWELAEQTNFARLGTFLDGEIYITPINIITDSGKIYFRTASGSKLTRLMIEEKVTVEFDRVEGGGAYSVNIHGVARLLTDSEEIAHAQSLNLEPWLHTEKIEFVEITPTSSSGRRFRLGS